METKNIKAFPKDFLWGSSTASFQCEGAANEDGKGESVIDRRVQDKSLCDYSVASDHYHRYKEDVKLMKECGLKAYRFSISWTRILPLGNGEINQKGLKFYDDLINELIENNIEPIVTIYHFDYPQGLIDQYGGWLDRRSVEDYVRYAEILFENYGDRVKYWLTINEQDHVMHHPFRLGLQGLDAKESVRLGFIANHHMSVAGALAIEKCHEMIPGSKIGPAACFDILYPATNNPVDVLAWKDAMDIRNYHVLDLNCLGEYNGTLMKYLEDRQMVPSILDGDIDIMKRNRPDFIGLNFYMSRSVKENPISETNKIGDIDVRILPMAEAGVYMTVKNENLKSTLWGWEVDEIGLHISARLLWDRYKLPLLITENGFGHVETMPNDKEMIQDDNRIEYLTKHLKSIKEAMNLGVEFLGYCNWSFIDLVSGHSGFSKRYGLVFVNRDEHDLRDLSRHKKKSFYWYKDLIETNGEKI